MIDHMGLARSIARRMRRGCDDVADLEQVAMMGLMDATKRWDPERGVPFHGYARHRIVGTIRDHMRCEADSVVQIGRYAQELARQRGDDFIRPEMSTMDYAERVTAHPGDAAAAVEARMTLAVLLEHAPLNDNQRKVVAGRMAERTCLDIGRELGVTESRACQIEAEAMVLLRAEAGVKAPWSVQTRVKMGVRVAQMAELAAAGVTEVGAIALRMGVTRSQAWGYVRRVRALGVPARAAEPLTP